MSEIKKQIEEVIFDMSFPLRRGYHHDPNDFWKPEGYCNVCRQIKRPVNKMFPEGLMAIYYGIRYPFWACMDCWNDTPSNEEIEAGARVK